MHYVRTPDKTSSFADLFIPLYKLTIQLYLKVTAVMLLLTAVADFSHSWYAVIVCLLRGFFSGMHLRSQHEVKLYLF